MKKILTLIVLALVMSSNMPGVTFSDFSTFQTETALNPFAKDLGACLGGGFFSGNNPGFPGVDISGKFVMLANASTDDPIIPANTLIALPYAQAEVGLPMDIVLIARGMALTVDGTSILLVGGGVKYKLLNDAAILPGIAAFATYNMISGIADFDASTISFNLAISKSLSPLPVALFIYGGMDSTTVSSKVLGFTTLKGTATTYRVNAGVRFTPFPLFYVAGDMSLFSTTTAYNISAGFSF